MEFVCPSLLNILEYGVDVGICELLTSGCFADDVLLVADSRARLKSMLESLQDESAKQGLHLHPDKTKVLTILKTTEYPV